MGKKEGIGIAEKDGRESRHEEGLDRMKGIGIGEKDVKRTGKKVVNRI
jgi:hypothetical protein